jgi:hypothetical protein
MQTFPSLRKCRMTKRGMGCFWLRAARITTTGGMRPVTGTLTSYADGCGEAKQETAHLQAKTPMARPGCGREGAEACRQEPKQGLVFSLQGPSPLPIPRPKGRLQPSGFCLSAGTPQQRPSVSACRHPGMSAVCENSSWDTGRPRTARHANSKAPREYNETQHWACLCLICARRGRLVLISSHTPCQRVPRHVLVRGWRDLRP